ncbi:MAG: beta-aspartyl-peptidase [Bacteroidetes bacterium]|nr:isoaspartyl peptidase/L-asparaginase [Bacteroidia bacterium]PCH67104.1 MAG: beta-aspartyl-peptidase [Bacteroidota bacterium]
MVKIRIIALLIAIFLFGCQQKKEYQNMEDKFTLVIHGGAGTILKKNMTPEREQAYKDILQESLITGHTILKNGGTSIDAVEAAVKVMEDSPLFNAGKGAVFTHDGKNEMDASIMDGKTLNAGAVSSITCIKNPIQLARSVMEKSPHVMLTGDGAEQFAKENGFEFVDPSYFHTEFRWNQLEKAKQSDVALLDHSDNVGEDNSIYDEIQKEKKFGTVGAVALDKHGNLAAATSTGGMTNKQFGRVGDSPIIGSGTYANNNTCAVSCTGHGEYFMRAVVAYDISAMIEYNDKSIEDAANEVIMKKQVDLGGEGGIIAVDKNGNIALTFNSAGMYRGFVKADGNIQVDIYK